MEYERSQWCNNQVAKIDEYTKDSTERQLRSVSIGYLEKLILRVDQFSSDCSTCENYKTSLEKNVEQLNNLENLTKEEKKEYRRMNNEILKHLKKEHKIVEIREYIHIFLIIGVVLGVLSALLLGDIYPIFMEYGFAGGAIGGVAIGFILDKKAQREGRLL